MGAAARLTCLVIVEHGFRFLCCVRLFCVCVCAFVLCVCAFFFFFFFLCVCVRVCVFFFFFFFFFFPPLLSSSLCLLQGAATVGAKNATHAVIVALKVWVFKWK